MITYYNKQEFEKVITEKIYDIIISHKAIAREELTTIYFEKLPDIEYGIRGKAVLKTSYNNNGYFIVPPKQ